MSVKAHTVVVASDIHFPHHHEALWTNFKDFLKDTRPSKIVVAGDIIDLSQLSIFELTEDALASGIDEIRMAAAELNGLLWFCGDVVIMPGNHEDRWRRAIFGTRARALKGAVGLTFKDQVYAQGLDKRIRFREENLEFPGLWLGKRSLLVRHGDRQAGRFGTQAVTNKALRETPTVSTIVGHHHRAELQAQTILGETRFAIANPHMSGQHGYNPWPNWQRGFTVLDFYGHSRLRDCSQFTPHLVVSDCDGSFSYAGRVYGKRGSTR